MNIAALKAELAAGHPGPASTPGNVAYNADHELAAVQINEVNRTKDRTSMSGSEVLNAIDTAEYNLLAPEDKDRVWQVIHLGTINPFGVEETLMKSIFGSGSTTIATLANLRKDDVSRAVELGLGKVRAGTIREARA